MFEATCASHSMPIGLTFDLYIIDLQVFRAFLLCAIGCGQQRSGSGAESKSRVLQAW